MIELARRGELRQHIEADALVASPTRFGKDALDQSPAERLATRLRTHINALHLAGGVVDPAQGGAAHHLAADASQQQAARRCRIGAGQFGELACIPLIVEADARTANVLGEDCQNRLAVLGKPCRGDIGH